MRQVERRPRVHVLEYQRRYRVRWSYRSFRWIRRSVLCHSKVV